MLLTIEFIDDGFGVRLISRGRVPGAVLVEAHQAFADRCLEHFADVRYWFSDHSLLQGAMLEPRHARMLAAVDHALARVNPNLVVANLAPGDLEFGMARTWQAFADETGWNVGTFRDTALIGPWLEAQIGNPVDLHTVSTEPPPIVFSDHDVQVGA